MVVQHILAVRVGTREVSKLSKDDKNSPDDDGENEIKKENDEIKSEVNPDDQVDEKIDEKVDEIIPGTKNADKVEEKSDVQSEEKSDIIKTEQEESEKNEESEKIEETEQNVDGTDESSKKIIQVDEYYVKYRNFSYLHCEWKTEEELLKGDKRIAAKLKRFKQKMANNTNIFENVSFYHLRYENVCLIYYQLF